MNYRVPRRRAKDERIRVVGHPTAPIGMGEHVRSVWHALNEVNASPAFVDIYGPFGTPDPEHVAPYAEALTPFLGDGVNIFCINGDEIEPALKHLRDRNAFAPGSRNIVFPAWELGRYPDEWVKQLERFDEVWAQSAFVHTTLSAAVDRPVVHVSLPCEVRRRGLLSRRWFGIRDTAYTFLYAFDFLSYVERKNPFGVIEAFRALVEQRPFDDFQLVIKTNNSSQRPEMAARFEAAVEGLRDHVLVIDRTLGSLEMKSLVWLSDCFVSLHRSEGFGYGLAEAMCLAKPVIATAYSGNMDFCTETTAKLIPYDLIPLKKGDYPHWSGQSWADPDLDAATRAMRDLLDSPEEGRMLGRNARRHMLVNFGYLAMGRKYGEVLKSAA